MKKEIVCPVCDGRGYVSWIQSTETSCSSGSKTCPHCNGTGWVEVDMTNADHIRSMTDEELAYLMAMPHCDRRTTDECRGFHGECPSCVLDWLKQPYKEEV